MGRDKALLPLAGISLAEAACRRLEALCTLVVVADGGAGKLPGRSSVADGPGAGPLAGILGAASAHPGRDLLVLACDLPEVPVNLLRRLLDPAPCDWRLPTWRAGVEPLCALYRPAALARLRELALAGVISPTRVAEDPDLGAGLVVERIGEREIRAFGEPAHLFRNLNTPGDLAGD